MSGAHCRSVSVVGRSGLLGRVFGDDVGDMIQQMYEEKGVRFVKPNGVKEFRGENDVLSEVVLNDGTALKADLCVVGAGVVPATDFLKDSGLDMDQRGFIKVNKHLETSSAGVFAAGDITTFPLFINNNKLSNVQHWQMALKQGRHAALNMLGKSCEIRSVPFFWTVLFGKSIRFTGYSSEGYDDIVMHGKPADQKFAAFYCREGRVLAVATMGVDPLAAKAADVFQSGEDIMKDDITKHFNIDF